MWLKIVVVLRRIKLTPWQILTKDVVLLFFIIYFIFQQKIAAITFWNCSKAILY
jgi:hypothetical protein